MPFQSEKQRRSLHANHPEIAKRWERDYSFGGRINYDEGGIGAWFKKKLKKYTREGIDEAQDKWLKEKGLDWKDWLGHRTNNKELSKTEFQADNKIQVSAGKSTNNNPELKTKNDK